MSYYETICRMCKRQQMTMSGICDDCYEDEIHLLELLGKSVKMWKWLRDHPGSDKPDYFLETHTDSCTNGCHLCEFCTAPGETEPDCSRCPGAGVLWKKIPSGCSQDDKSPFADWLEAVNAPDGDLRILVSSASAMVAGLEEMIEKIEEERRNA